MKVSQNLLIFISIILTSTLFGYRYTVAVGSDSKPVEADASAETVQQEGLEAADALKNYTIEQREEMLEEAKRLLTYLDQRINQLAVKIEAQAASATETVKAQWRETLQALRDRRAIIEQWLNDLQYDSEEAWEEVKQGFSQAYRELAEAIHIEEARFEDNQAVSPNAEPKPKPESKPRSKTPFSYGPELIADPLYSGWARISNV